LYFIDFHNQLMQALYMHSFHDSADTHL